MTTFLAHLVMPAIRWDPAHGYEHQRPAIDRALAMGMGGFIIFGGTMTAVRELTRELRSRSAAPLLIASDLERGAGQQFEGATALPPLAALASLDEPGVVRRAASITAQEAAALGINWVLAPVCDIDLADENPIVGTRSFGRDPARAAELAAEWIDGCQSQGVLACAKHFPGHGRTVHDSHRELPTVNASAEEMQRTDLATFRAAINAGVASVMTAHVGFPAFDSSGVPATLSAPILRTLLREEMAFDGLIVTDALIMEGVLAGVGEAEACLRALEAGCDILLYPTDVGAVIEALGRAARDKRLDSEHLHASSVRRARAAQWAYVLGDRDVDWDANHKWALEIATKVIRVERGPCPAITSPLDVIIIDDDVGGPYPPPSRQPFLDAFAAVGAEARVVDAPSGDGRRSTIVALFGDVRGWKGRAGYSRESLLRVEAACASVPDAVIVMFGNPRRAADVRGGCAVIGAWGGEALMQRAAARWLLGDR